MKHRVHGALAMALAAAGTLAAPSAVVTAPSSVVAQQSGQKVEQGMAAPTATRTTPPRAQFIAETNVPWTPRRDVIWMGRPRDSTGMPWGSWRR